MKKRQKNKPVDYSAFKPRVRERSFILSVILATAKMLFFIVLLLGVAGTGLVVGVSKAWIETTPELDLSSFNNQANTSYIYDKNGGLICTYRGIENRQEVKISQMPQNLINAVIAVEDMRFYSHNGIDARRIVGATIGNLTGGKVQGGSTITQQVVKLTMLSDEQTFKRKLQEAYLAIQLEKEVSKAVIVEKYLNLVYLGESNYGVQVASKDYFGKDVSQLTLRECACLARVIRDPSWYNPRKNYYKNHTPEIIEEKTNDVLWMMLSQKLITQAEYDQAKSETLNVLVNSPDNNNKIVPNLYYVEYAIYDVVTKMLRVEGLEDTKTNRSKMEYKLRTGGYKIYTALDPGLQKSVQDVVTNWNGYPKMRKSADAVFKSPLGKGQYMDIVQPQAAATVIDWHTGEVMAIVGGRSEPTALKQLNRAYAMGSMPVGSSIKPLSVYGPAFDMGYSPGTPVINAPIRIRGWDTEKGYPSNYGGKQFNGCESMRIALNRSHNTAAAQALYTYVGLDNSYKYLLKLGISEAHINKTGFGLALGSSGPSTVEMAAGFAAIANRGRYLEPIAFVEVRNSDNSTYINAQQVQRREQVFQEGTAWMLVDVLKGCVGPNGTGSRANFGGFTVAGKTGTNSDECGVTFSGMTAWYTASVWIGSEDYKSLASSSTGGEFAATLWAAIMKQVHAYMGIKTNKDIVSKSAQDAGLVKVTVCGVSGMLPNASCMKDRYGTNTDLFRRGTEPTKQCNMHRSVRICTRSGMSPSQNCPIKTVSGLYIPEGHPLRNDTADAVREYFKGATTSQIGATAGVCTACGSGSQVTVKTEREQVLEYAAKAISEANKILGSSKTNPTERDEVTAARDTLQALLDRNASTDEIREQVSVCKIINEAVVAKIKKR